MPSSPPNPATLAAMGPQFYSDCRRIAAWSLELEHVTKAMPAQLPEILLLAEALDQYFAWEPFGDPDAPPDVLAAIALTQLKMVTDDDLKRAIEKLPVFPMVAQRALGVLLRENWKVSDLESIAASDQTLALQVVGAANSWINAPRQPIKTLSHAIAYIGADQASRIFYSASMRPMFASRELHKIWDHSLDAAQVAQDIAKATSVNPQEAYLAGLVHDIGKLAMATLPAAFQMRFARLAEVGCETLLVERALCGLSHAQLGAKALRMWQFPESLAHAVEFHHQPERTDSPMAAILYLTECRTRGGEDTSTLARLLPALQCLGLTEEWFEDFEVKLNPGLDALRFAA
jgi:putative nucleotidyltransferase with HDIG domain